MIDTATAAASELRVLTPDWNPPPGVRACTTLRFPGCSGGPWAALNLATHTGDADEAVQRNRRMLHEGLRLPSAPLWLAQQHGTDIVAADRAPPDTAADGSYATTPGPVCAVMSADCLPVFLCCADASAVMLLHAGWRGLAAGIIEAGVTTLRRTRPNTPLLAAFGPTIGADVYEVGDEVRQQLLQDPTSDEAHAFHPAPRPNHWYANLHLLATLHLQRLKVTATTTPPRCTYSNPDQFFSHRRDPHCGRMASLIWLD